MGWDFLPIYGEDIGSAIETVEVLIKKIKSNKFDKSDLEQLVEALVEIKNAVDKNEG